MIKVVVESQLRDFTALNKETGRFVTVPEYPEFAWFEIQSPGKFPSVVNVDNIKETRYSRNPRMARALTDFGWDRELNEGVKRIFNDMEHYYL